MRLLFLFLLLVVPLELRDELRAVAVSLRFPAKRVVQTDKERRPRDVRDVLRVVEALPLDLVLRDAARQPALSQDLQIRTLTALCCFTV